MKEKAVAAGAKRLKAKWDSEAERKIIDIWADILKEFNGKMLTRKKKEAIATVRLNEYMNEELNRSEQYSEKAVCNKIDSIMKKGKQMYVAYQKKGETGKEYTQEEIDLDMEAAELAWPNFKTFLLVLKTIQHWVQVQWMTLQWLLSMLQLKWWCQMSRKTMMIATL